MYLISKVQPVYLPEAKQHSVLRLGLKTLDHQEWLVVDDDFGQFYENKMQVRKLHGDKVYGSLPGSEPAQQELQRLVLGHLTNDHSNKYEITGKTINNLPCNLSWPLDDFTLWHTSLWVQDDICLMELRDGEYCLTAASVCAPSNWALEEKIGRSLDAIHGTIPGYAQRLSRRVNKLFANLKPARPLLRYNWSIQDSPELFWRKDLLQKNEAQAKPDELFWRVERQVLRRLPDTGAIVFTIRIFIHSFSVMSRAAEFPEILSRLLGQLPAAEKNYKGLLALDSIAHRT